MRAGAAEIDVTPPVGLEITHPVRANVGAHDPLFVKALVLQDAADEMLAIVCTDLIGTDFGPADELRKRIADELGIENVLLNFAHPHSSRGFGGYGDLPEESPEAVAWAQGARDAFLAVIAEARDKLAPVTLKAGRAPAQVGFNRRVTADNGYVFMADNPDGAVVPWVNVLLVLSDVEGEVDSDDGQPMAILFEHAAHPVIVPNGTALISADFPGAAVVRIREVLGPDVIPMFAQGCQGNINGHPLRSTHENADAAGVKLGDAVLKAVESAEPITADTLRVRTGRTEMPTCELPPWEVIQGPIEKLKAEFVAGENPYWRQEEIDNFTVHFEKLEQMMAAGESPPPWRMEATVVSLGDEWVLVAYANEMFCQYELWVDEVAPFKHNMTFGLTNGATGYVANDAALALGTNGGYEAGCLPNLGSCDVMTRHYGPPAVGCEKIIHDLVTGLWTE
jgi:neutral ceramidase